ncbi:MAG TPA: flagellar export protein FliJ [Chroococcales cyanobacterium]
MAKFLYKLQKVLDFRAKREEKAKQGLSDANHERDVQQDLLDQLTARHASAQRQMGDQLTAGRANDVQASNDYVSSLDGKVKDQKDKLAKAQATVDEAKKRYIETSKERSIMEKHRDKEKLKWFNEEKRIEAINLDEMANTIFLKKRRIEAEEMEAEEEKGDEESSSSSSGSSGSPWIDGLLQSAKIAQEMKEKRDL